MSGEGDFGIVGGDDGVDLEEDLLFDGEVIFPASGVGEGVDEDVEGGGAKLFEVDDEELGVVDARVLFEHFLDLFCDIVDVGGVVVANPDGLFDAAVGHARDVDEGDGREEGVGNVDGALFKGADLGESPANVLNVPFDFPLF